eukprot:3877575-Prymnesium_polylepis.1
MRALPAAATVRSAAHFTLHRLESKDFDQIHKRNERAHARRLNDVALQQRTKHCDGHHQLHVGAPTQHGQVRLVEEGDAECHAGVAESS